MVNVSWNDATAFCQWLSKRQGGVKFELPTEAQWEYACRAGTTTFWHCGDSNASLKEYAWFGSWVSKGSQPVGRLRPNGFGLYDMHGNVWEWCADWFAPDYNAKSAPNDPSGPTTGSSRVFRGANWAFHAGMCRSAIRSGGLPGYRTTAIGFRVHVTKHLRE